MKNLNIILVLLAVFIFGLVGLPNKKAVAKITKEIASLEKEKKEKSAEFKKIQAEFKELKESNKDVQHFISDSFNQDSFIEKILEFAENSGVDQIDSLQFSQTQDSHDSTKITANFSLEGRRTSVANFLKKIESEPLFMGVESFGISTDEDGNSSMNVSLYSFYFAETS